MKKQITQKMYDEAIKRIESLSDTITEMDCERERLEEHIEVLSDKNATLSKVLNAISTMALVR